MNDVLQKLADYALKSIPTLLMSGTGYQFLNGKWFGQAIFQAYRSQLGLGILTPPVSDDLYSAFGSEGLTSSISQLSAFRLLVSIALMLALLAHVLFKRNVAARASANRTDRNDRFRSGWPNRVRSIYQTHYYALTVGIFGVLLSLFMLADVRLALVVLLGLIAAPVALYLILYSKDAVNGGFVEQFVWISLLIMLFVVLAGWPYLYGRRLFNPTFSVASIPANAPDHCDAQELLKGPIFVTNANGRSTFFRLCFRPPDNRYVDFFSYDGSHTVSGTMPFTSAVANFVPPQTVPGTLEGLREQLSKK